MVHNVSERQIPFIKQASESMKKKFLNTWRLKKLFTKKAQFTEIKIKVRNLFFRKCQIYLIFVSNRITSEMDSF